MPILSSTHPAAAIVPRVTVQVAAMLEKQERAANGEVDDEDEATPPADTPGVASSSANAEVRFVPYWRLRLILS